MPLPKWVEIAEQGAIGLAEYYLEGGTDPATVRGILADHYPGYVSSSYDAIISRANESIQAAEFLEYETGGSALADVLIPVDPSKSPGYYYKALVEIEIGGDILPRYIYDRYGTSLDLEAALENAEQEALDQLDDSPPPILTKDVTPHIISSRITAITRGE